MKRLSNSEIISVLEASSDDVENAAQLLGRKFSEMPPGWIQDGLAKGFYHAAKIAVDGHDRFIVVYHVTDQKALLINAAAQLTPESNFSALLDGVLSIAKNLRCQAIECLTTRAGMMQKLLSANCQIVGVTLRYEF